MIVSGCLLRPGPGAWGRRGAYRAPGPDWGPAGAAPQRAQAGGEEVKQGALLCLLGPLCWSAWLQRRSLGLAEGVDILIVGGLGLGGDSGHSLLVSVASRDLDRENLLVSGLKYFLLSLLDLLINLLFLILKMVMDTVNITVKILGNRGKIRILIINNLELNNF